MMAEQDLLMCWLKTKSDGVYVMSAGSLLVPENGNACLWVVVVASSKC